MSSKRLEGKTAIVTGASSGIGRAIALLFAEEGATVFVCDICKEAKEGGPTTTELICKQGGQAEFIKTDISQWRDVDRMVERVVTLHGRLDILVNNAATAVDKSLLDTSEKEWDHVMNINAKGVFMSCKRAIQQMKDQDIISEARGRIINISSQHGMICAPDNFAYGVGKSAVVYMTRQIAVDYAKDNIICNAVAPGRVLTGKPLSMVDSLDYSRNRTPWPRLGKPEDVARAVLFLASDEASYIVGTNLMVDGGWMAG